MSNRQNLYINASVALILEADNTLDSVQNKETVIIIKYFHDL